MKIINALLSCPNDVYLNFRTQIYNAIKEVNFYIEKTLNVHIELAHYSSSAYSKVGKPAQDHLDDILINSSDVCFAFFYHDMGTKTRNYQSGTDEEIHLMMKREKQVFLFFIKDDKNDVKMDERLKKYVKEISAQCYYTVIIGKRDIKKKVANDILNYFSNDFKVSLEKIADPLNVVPFFKKLINFGKKEKSIVSLVGEINELDSNLRQEKELFATLQEQFASKKETEKLLANSSYKDLIKSLDNGYKRILSNVSSALVSEAVFEDVFDQKTQEFLKIFVKNHGLTLNEEFLSFNGERVYKNTVSYQAGIQCENTKIKDKINKLNNLSTNLKEYYSWEFYLSKFDNVIAVPLGLKNGTTEAQSNLTLNLYVNKADYVRLDDLKITDEQVACGMFAIGINSFFDPSTQIYNLKPYPRMFSPIIRDENFLGMISPINFLATIKNQFNNLFDYSIESDGETYHLKVEFDLINPEEICSLPTYIFVNKNTKIIRYEITGSDLSRKIVDIIKISSQN